MQAKGDYCSPACKVLHKPHGRNADIVKDLVGTDFSQVSVRARFCLTCLRAFSSAHYFEHALHPHGGNAEEAGVAPNPAPVLVEIVEREWWNLVAEDVIRGPLRFQQIKSLVLNGVHMVAVHNRQPPDVHGIHHCANGFCNKSVEQPSLRAGMLVQVQHAVSFGARRGTGSGRGRG